MFLIYWSQVIFKEASGKRTGGCEKHHRILALCGTPRTGQVIRSFENLDLERDTLLRIYKIGMEKLNEKIINLVNEINEIQFYLNVKYILLSSHNEKMRGY